MAAIGGGITSQDEIKMMIEVNKFLEDPQNQAVSVSTICSGLGIPKYIADSLLRNYYKLYNKKVQGIFLVAYLDEGSRLIQTVLTDSQLKAEHRYHDMYLIGDK